MPDYFQTVKPPYVAANFDYFRIPRERWELMLTRLTQMGINIVTIAVPWSFHESKEGSVDFQGVSTDRHDLAGLIRLVQKLDFCCILNVGPYHQNSGLLHQGLPAWLAENPPPEAVQEWYKAVSRPVVDFNWPAGPIIALQLGGPGPAEALSLPVDADVTQVKWPIWLRKRYGEVDALNAAFGTAYTTMSRVDFPTAWHQEPTPLEEDAKLFLREQQQAVAAASRQTIVEAGWQVPILPSDAEEQLDIPHLQNITDLDKWEVVDATSPILNLTQPIRIENNPVEIGSCTVWAINAPIRADGSLRRKFWRLRQKLGPYQNVDMVLDDPVSMIISPAGGAVMADQDTNLKVALPEDARKAACYRLRATGELIVDDNLRVFRGKLSGQYLLEDDSSQTDRVFYITAPDEPLPDFIAVYLKRLLNAQRQALLRCSTILETLSEVLNFEAATKPDTGQSKKTVSSTVLDEARRGLQDADAALKKAVRSIGGLESGFDTMLDRASLKAQQSAKDTLVFASETFEADTKTILSRINEICDKSAVELKPAADRVQQTLDGQALTLEQYQQSYAGAVATAAEHRQTFDHLTAQLRTHIAARSQPLAVWYVHDQIERAGKGLLWGVLRP